MTNSIVRGYGWRFPAATGVNMASSPNASVTHNDISDGLYAGLSGGGACMRVHARVCACTFVCVCLVCLVCVLSVLSVRA